LKKLAKQILLWGWFGTKKIAKSNPQEPQEPPNIKVLAIEQI